MTYISDLGTVGITGWVLMDLEPVGHTEATFPPMPTDSKRHPGTGGE